MRTERSQKEKCFSEILKETFSRPDLGLGFGHLSEKFVQIKYYKPPPNPFPSSFQKTCRVLFPLRGELVGAKKVNTRLGDLYMNAWEYFCSTILGQIVRFFNCNESFHHSTISGIISIEIVFLTKVWVA